MLNPRAQLRRNWIQLSVLAGACILALLQAVPARAQVDATRWRSGLVTLNQGWLVQDGDDLRWTKPDFDDSGWQTVELDDLGAAEPGWRWYRIHVKLGRNHDPVHFLVAGGEGTYELYINGLRQSGAEIRPYLGARRPTEQIFTPRTEDNDLTIALRTHATAMYTIWHLPLFLTASIGSPDVIENERETLEGERLYTLIPSIAINIMIILAGIGAFALFRSQHGHREYLWLGLFLSLLGISNGLLYSASAGLLQMAWNNMLADPLIYVYTLMQIEFTFSFAEKPVNRMWRVYEALILVCALLNPLVPAGLVPGNLYISIEGLVIFPAALLLPVLLAFWFKKGNREAGLLIVPSLLPAASTAMFSIGSASIFTGWGKLDFLANPIPVGPISLQISDLADFLFVLAIGIVMFFRFTRVSREQTRVAAELEAAREIQQRLVPARLPEVKGFAIEAAYFPALEVGGDFYQVLEQDDGGQLVVIGDVSGKGLKAAMTGTLALGALRALAAEGLGPAAVLMRLNQQLTGTQNGGFVTCLCAYITIEGDVTFANAGHLPPYRNGAELPVPCDLPLGILAGETYEERRFRLRTGDRLTLLSDGVLEARDADGVLFGFDRTRAVSARTAAEIAEEARKYGQEDDITVLTVVVVGDQARTLEEARASVAMG
ncbi:MAG TPA: SpoIIE family protein phosphatase [Terracidiphilus sp.]